MRGNTIVPFPRTSEAQPSRPLSFVEIIERHLPESPMPNIESVLAARSDLLDSLRKLGPREDDVAQLGLDFARESFYHAVEAFEKPFTAWKEHIFNLIVASEAYRAGREDEIATNFEGLNDDWENASLTAMRDPVDIGLSQQIENLANVLTMFHDTMIPPLLARETERWGEQDTAVRQLASDIRLVIVKTASHTIEALSPKLIDERTAQVTQSLHEEAKALLAPNNDKYKRGTVALALHRMLPALRGEMHSRASKIVALAYQDLIGTAHTSQNASIILSYGFLMQNAADNMIRSTKMILKPSVAKLREIARLGETPDIQVLARNTHKIIAARLDDLGI